MSSLEKYQLEVFAQLLIGLFIFIWDSLVAQLVKYLPATQETWVRSLGWEDSLEEGMTTHSSILAWRIPIGGGATVHGVAKSCTQLSD